MRSQFIILTLLVTFLGVIAKDLYSAGSEVKNEEEDLLVDTNTLGRQIRADLDVESRKKPGKRPGKPGKKPGKKPGNKPGNKPGSRDICKCLETDGGCALAYDTLVATIRTLSREFYISFEFSAAKYVNGYQNVIDFTNQGFGDQWGSRIPIVDVLDNNQIITCFALNGYPNWCYTITKDLEVDTWYTLEITQEKAITGKYFYQVSLNGDVQQSQVNTYPAQFNNVRVYGSQGGDNSNGDKYQGLDGNIQNLYINPVGPSEPNC